MPRWLYLIVAAFVVFAAQIAAPGGMARAQELQPSIAPSSVASAAGSLALSQSCANGRVNVSFSWQGNDPSSLQQWLDLSTFDNGFAPGTFISAGPQAGFSTAFTWNGLLPNTTHFVRVNQQLYYGAWDPSPTFVFTTSNCPGGGPISAGGPASILSLSCQSSIATASLSNVAPASTQNAGLAALPYDTISCSAGVSGQYVALTWRGPQNDTSAAPQFVTHIDGPRPGNAPYDISLQLDWGGNPAIAHITVTPILPNVVYPGYTYYCPSGITIVGTPGMNPC